MRALPFHARAVSRLAVLSAVICVASALLTPSVGAQAIEVELSAGLVKPVAPASPMLTTGTQLGIGVSRWLSGKPIAIGVEASYVRFGNKVDPLIPDRLGLVNVFATGKYRFGDRAIRPYVALAAGIAGERKPDGSALGSGGELNGSGRATIGLETRLGSVRGAVEGGYATVSTLQYRTRFVRYVPVTVKLSF